MGDVMPGSRIRIRQDSPLYRGGLRAGALVSLAEDLGEFIDATAKRLGMTRLALRNMFGLRLTRSNCRDRVPIVRVDPCSPFPDGFYLPMDRKHFEPESV